jgi:hypothetical protein
MGISEDGVCDCMKGLIGIKALLTNLVMAMALAGVVHFFGLDLLSKAINQEPLALSIISENLQNDEELVMEAVKTNVKCLQLAFHTLRGSREFALKVIEQIPAAIFYFEEQLTIELLLDPKVEKHVTSQVDVISKLREAAQKMEANQFLLMQKLCSIRPMFSRQTIPSSGAIQQSYWPL